MLSMMISGPKQLGNDIDTYLSPLIDELKVLWADGVYVFDDYRKETFKLRAMIFCTINDFPAYGNCSGYSVTSVVSDSVQPVRWQPTRLLCPWDSPGKNTGVGCHFLLQCIPVVDSF